MGHCPWSVKGKVKLLYACHEGMWEIGNISRYINFTPRVLYSRGDPPCALGLGSWVSLEPVWRLRRKYELHAIVGNRNTIPQSPRP